MKDKTKQFDEILKQFSTGEELNDFLKITSKARYWKNDWSEFNNHVGDHEYQKVQSITLETAQENVTKNL